MKKKSAGKRARNLKAVRGAARKTAKPAPQRPEVVRPGRADELFFYPVDEIRGRRLPDPSPRGAMAEYVAAWLPRRVPFGWDAV